MSQNIVLFEAQELYILVIVFGRSAGGGGGVPQMHEDTALT
jgi:hypothetical protein